MFRKVILVLICFILFYSPVEACPHVDSKGNIHLQTYNENYTEMNMIYPEDKYLYIKNVTMDVIDMVVRPNEDDLLGEIFSFPLFQDLESYYTYYWYVNDNLSEYDYGEVDVETTVKGLEYKTVSSPNYNLKVNFSNTFNNGQNYVDDVTQEVYYDVITKSKASENLYTSIINDNNIELLSNDILEISTRFNIIRSDGYFFENTFDDIYELHDVITIEMKSLTTSENMVAVNLNKNFNEENYIEVSKVNDEYYSFDVNEPGVYAVIEKPETEILIEEIYDVPTEENEKESSENSFEIYYYIAALTIAIIAIFCTIIYIKRKKRK